MPSCVVAEEIRRELVPAAAPHPNPLPVEKINGERG